MPDAFEARSRLAAQRQRDTEPELRIRRELHRRGLRYRVDQPIPIPRRRADIVFSRARVAVFIDGCFWHGCPEHATLPKSNAAWWQAKLEANVRRDRDTDLRLSAAGWIAIRAWEHENPAAVADAIELCLRSTQPQHPPTRS